MDDRHLIQRMLQRDHRAVHTFYRIYTPKLTRYISSKIQDPHDSEEVLQDTLFAFLEAIRDFQGKSRVSTFLFSICHHKIIDYYRRKKIRHLVFSRMLNLENLISPLLNPEEQLDASLLKQRLHKAFSRILPQYKEILQSKYFYGMSVAEIARACSSTLKRTESLLFRARKAFVRVFSALP